MLVREVMTRSVFSLPADATINDAIRLLTTERISCVPVVDGDGRVMGVVSESDLLQAPLEPDPRAHMRPVTAPPPRPSRVDEVMTASPFTTREQADVAQVAKVLAERGWKSLPVVRENRLVGIISRSDIIRTLSRRDAQISRDVTANLASYGQPDWCAEVRDAQVTIHGPQSARDAHLAETLAASVAGVRRVVVDDWAIKEGRD
ncbi:CBS domain-containing protein [Dermatophilaceae bacterium Sec6.4]